MTEVTPSLENSRFQAFFKITVLRCPAYAGGYVLFGDWILCLLLAKVEDGAVEHQIEEAVRDRDENKEGLHGRAAQLAVDEGNRRADQESGLDKQFDGLLAADDQRLGQRLDDQTDTVHGGLVDGIDTRHSPGFTKEGGEQPGGEQAEDDDHGDGDGGQDNGGQQQRLAVAAGGVVFFSRILEEEGAGDIVAQQGDGNIEHTAGQRVDAECGKAVEHFDEEVEHLEGCGLDKEGRSGQQGLTAVLDSRFHHALTGFLAAQANLFFLSPQVVHVEVCTQGCTGQAGDLHAVGGETEITQDDLHGILDRRRPGIGLGQQAVVLEAGIVVIHDVVDAREEEDGDSQQGEDAGRGPDLRFAIEVDAVTNGKDQRCAAAEGEAQVEQVVGFVVIFGNNDGRLILEAGDRAEESDRRGHQRIDTDLIVGEQTGCKEGRGDRYQLADERTREEGQNGAEELMLGQFFQFFVQMYKTSDRGYKSKIP